MNIEIHVLQTKRKEITYSIDAEGVADAEGLGPEIATTLLLVPIVLPELHNHIARRRCKFNRKNSLVDSDNPIRPSMTISAMASGRYTMFNVPFIGKYHPN